MNSRSTQHGRMTRRLAAAGAVVLALGFSACSDDTIESIEDDVQSAVTDAVDAVEEVSGDAIETATRLFVTEQAEDEFDAVGHPIEGDLTCTADASEDLTSVEIACSGTTVDGGNAELTGTTSEIPGVAITEIEGEFVGTVDGEEVLNTDVLGD